MSVPSSERDTKFNPKDSIQDVHHQQSPSFQRSQHAGHAAAHDNSHRAQQPHTHHKQRPQHHNSTSSPHSNSQSTTSRNAPHPQPHSATAASFNRVQTPEENPWLFTAEEVSETPSRLQNIPQDVENLVIAKTCKFINDCGAKDALNLPQLTTSVAMKFFQRFYMLESMLIHKPPLVAAACLFLSCKVQETLKRLKDIIYWTVKVRTRNTIDYPDGLELNESSPNYNDEKNHILDKEREVLRVLNFDLNIDHPYKHYWELIRSFFGGNKMQLQRLFQTGWNFINDSFRNYMHVQYDAKEIATAALYLSTKLEKLELPDGTRRDKATGKRLLAWHELYNVDLPRIEQICHLMLNVYDMDKDSIAGETFDSGKKVGIVEGLPEQGPPTKRRKVASPEKDSEDEHRAGDD